MSEVFYPLPVKMDEDPERFINDNFTLIFRILNDIRGWISAGKLNISDLVDIANLLTVADGKIVIGANAIGTGLDGILIHDGTRPRATFGEVSSNVYGLNAWDSSGNKTVDLCKIMGASAYQYVAAQNEISTTVKGSGNEVLMTNMSITFTFPKCVALLMSVCRLDTSSDTALNAVNRFNYDGNFVGYFTGIAQNMKAVAANMHVMDIAAGSHTIQLRWYTDDNEGDTIYCTKRRLMVLYWEVQ